MRRPPRFGIVIPRALATLALTACPLAACSGPYERALQEMAPPHADRLAVRVDELIECATHAADSLERVAQWYRLHDARHAPEPAALRVARAEAQAAAFDATRRALSVADVAAEMEPDAAHRIHPILDAATTVAASITRAVGVMERGSPDDPAWLDAMRDANDEAGRAIDTLRARAADTVR